MLHLVNFNWQTLALRKKDRFLHSQLKISLFSLTLFTLLGKHLSLITSELLYCVNFTQLRAKLISITRNLFGQIMNSVNEINFKFA